MKNFKFLIIATLISAISCLTYLGVKIGNDFYLENKKRECWKDIYTVKDLYDKEHRYISRYFYSPKLNTCLYWGFTVNNYDKENQEASLTLKKLYTNEIIEEIKFCMSKNDCDTKVKNETLMSIEGKSLDKLSEKYK